MTLISFCFSISAIKLEFEDVPDLFQITYFSVSHFFLLIFESRNTGLYRLLLQMVG